MHSGSPAPSLYVRTGERIQRAWVKVLQWDVDHTGLRLRGLVRRNEQSREPVTGEGPVVSLTTYGRRIQSVHITIESIAAGSLRPARLILWLDDEQAYLDLPDSLKRLKSRGLEVLLSRNYGPHTKYYPYLEASQNFTGPLVTADDDTLYAPSWLRGLAESYASNPQVVSCYRAHEIKLSEEGFAPYVSWGRCLSGSPSFRYFGTGVSGCLYPPALLDRLKALGTAFEQVCPKADDVWLHVNALRAGYKIKQVFPWQMVYPLLPDTQGMGLALTNVHSAANDLQIQKTYTESDLNLLRSEE